MSSESCVEIPFKTTVFILKKYFKMELLCVEVVKKRKEIIGMNEEEVNDNSQISEVTSSFKHTIVVVVVALKILFFLKRKKINRLKTLYCRVKWLKLCLKMQLKTLKVFIYLIEVLIQINNTYYLFLFL